MIQNNRERMIARYTGGRMRPEEERRFLDLVESDPELRRAIETERTIDRTLRRDRDALPRIDAETRSQVLAMLGALAPASIETTTAGMGIGKIAMIVAGLGLTAGALFLTRAHETAIESIATRPAATTAAAPRPISLPRPSPSQEMSRGEEKEVPGDRMQRAATTEARHAKPRGITTETRVETTRGASPSREMPVPVEPTAESPSRAADTAAASHTPRAQAPAPRAADSARLDITIDLDKMKRKPRQP